MYNSILLLALSGNMLIDSLEVSTLVVAMPSIGRGLGLTPPAAAGFMICFALGFGASVLPARRLTARLGRRRVYLVAFMDDHSRFIVSYGLHTKQSRYP